MGWLALWVPFCASPWIVPVITHGSYEAAIQGSMAGRLLPIGMLASVAGFAMALEFAAVLVWRGRAALRVERDRIVYVSRWLISIPIAQVAVVEIQKSVRDAEIAVRLHGGRKKSIPTALFDEPALEVADRIRAAAGAEGLLK